MRHFLIAAVACSLFGLPVYAEEKHHQGEKAAAAQAEGPMTEGEVRKVDKDAKKITIKHGPLVKLEMPAMTMVFQVKDPAMLDKVKAGDKVRFDAEKIGGAFTLTQIEPVK